MITIEKIVILRDPKRRGMPHHRGHWESARVGREVEGGKELWREALLTFL